MAALAGGALPFLAVLILSLVGLIVGLYTRKGLGIDHHPYRNYHGGSPGADLPSDDFSGDRTIFTEQVVRATWRRTHSDAQAARAAAANRSRQERRQLRPPKQSLRLPIPSPIPPLH